MSGCETKRRICLSWCYLWMLGIFTRSKHLAGQNHTPLHNLLTVLIGRVYKTVVVIFLGGGADLYNLLVPKSGCGVDGVDKDYATVRGVVALDQESLHPITVDSDSPQQPCDTFGIHPSFPLLKELYDDKECTFVANIGGLVAPMTKKQYKDKSVTRPRSLFSHNFMTKYAMNLHTDYQDADGVLGRLIAASTQKPNAFKSSIYSIAGRSKMVKGELVETIVSHTTGITRLPELDIIKVCECVRASLRVCCVSHPAWGRTSRDIFSEVLSLPQAHSLGTTSNNTSHLYHSLSYDPPG